MVIPYWNEQAEEQRLDRAIADLKWRREALTSKERDLNTQIRVVDKSTKTVEKVIAKLECVHSLL